MTLPVPEVTVIVPAARMLSLVEDPHNLRRSLSTYSTNDLSMIYEIGADDKPSKIKICTKATGTINIADSAAQMPITGF